MELTVLKSELLKLPKLERDRFIQEILSIEEEETNVSNAQRLRRETLDNKQGSCPHCGHNKYVKFGFKSNSQRYKCKSCKRSFTEYTGTWMAGLHKKEKVDAYLNLMLEEKSLDKIKDALSINKKTAFDWRHKVLASFSEKGKDFFSGIVESDETFFLFSEKGRKQTKRESRKRGGTSKSRGISNDQVAVIATQDRKSTLDLTVATMGRIKKSDIVMAIGSRVDSNNTILCSDGHMSYKGFALDNKIEHHVLNASLKQRVKSGTYHIQHVNSTHNRVKKWLDNQFWGVSTKYLQQYLNWYRIKEQIKFRNDRLNAFMISSCLDITAHDTYKNIEQMYEKLISTPT